MFSDKDISELFDSEADRNFEREGFDFWMTQFEYNGNCKN